MNRFLELFRFKISFMVGLSAFAGACLYNHRIHPDHLYAVLAALSLAAGTSALNQYQERAEDARMKRTRRRPIPKGTVQPKDALIISVLLICMSLCLIFLVESFTGAVLAVSTVIIYNLMYTPLKKRTPFALLIGSVTGSIPPLLGYAAMGGDITSVKIVLVALVMYVWQTPHFTMLAEKYNEDYVAAGFKTLSSEYGRSATTLFIRIWIAAYVCALSFVPVAGLYNSHQTSILHSVMTVITAILLLILHKNTSKTFHILNMSMVIFFVMLVVDSIII